MKHTPGPWRYLLYGSVDEMETATRIDVTDSSRTEQPHYCTPIAVCRRVASEGHFSFNPPNAEANARLIAVAPELLEACKDAVEFAKVYGPGQCRTVEMLQAVISKAEGNG